MRTDNSCKSQILPHHTPNSNTMPGSICRATSGLDSFCWEPFRCACCDCLVDDSCTVFMLDDNAYCGEYCRNIHNQQSLGFSVSPMRPACGGGMRRTTSGSTVSSTSSLSSASSQSVASLQDTKLVRFETIPEQQFLTTSAGIVDSFLTGVFKGLAHVGSNAMHNF